MTTRRKEPDIIHEIFPAEKRLARIDKLDMELERKRGTGAVRLTEYVRAKQALEVRRAQEWRRIERANGWGQFEAVEPEAVEPEHEPPTEADEPETPRATRYVHYAIFWLDLWLLTMLICWILPHLKK